MDSGVPHLCKLIGVEPADGVLDLLVQLALVLLRDLGRGLQTRPTCQVAKPYTFSLYKITLVSFINSPRV